MGACDFSTIGRGASAREAFNRARDDAAYDSGHGGYTGTIAEKDSYVVIPFTGTDADAIRYAGQLLSDCDERIDDKWGPAGAIRLSDDEHGQRWLFFGWASS